LAWPLLRNSLRRIRYRHLNQLVRAAAALPGPKLDVALWHRLDPWSTAEAVAAEGSSEPGDLAAEVRREIARLRGQVALCLEGLAQRAEKALRPALARARQNWEQVDSMTIVDAPLARTLADARRRLETAAHREEQPSAVVAVALEGLLVLEAAFGITNLMERRLSSLIRLRVRGSDDLLPEGRPFLDLGRALAEAARAWT
jgi:hypothetical protein